ncbi:MAG: class I SAM-dependent methyltransferase [Chitinophagaceae bacterium]|jgi:hypothetical protein|nr:class I SAM-dependent methyltransferase [Chitinophagaceae bacterium]
MANRNVLLMQDMYFQSDIQFNRIYPGNIQKLSSRHWTPLAVARKAAAFLASEAGIRILDIGSGAGKFCLAAGYHRPEVQFFGVEQRESLFHVASHALASLGLENVTFINRNFTQLNFGHYDNFYVYNPFYENLSGTEKIDDSIDYSSELYHYYNRYLYKQLQLKPTGTRVATFHSLEDEMPPAYHIVGTDMDTLLKFWIKV